MSEPKKDDRMRATLNSHLSIKVRAFMTTQNMNQAEALEWLVNTGLQVAAAIAAINPGLNIQPPTEQPSEPIGVEFDTQSEDSDLGDFTL